MKQRLLWQLIAIRFTDLRFRSQQPRPALNPQTARPTTPPLPVSTRKWTPGSSRPGAMPGLHSSRRLSNDNSCGALKAYAQRVWLFLPVAEPARRTCCSLRLRRAMRVPGVMMTPPVDLRQISCSVGLQTHVGRVAVDSPHHALLCQFLVESLRETAGAAEEQEEKSSTA